jgi:hypothetical protein
VLTRRVGSNRRHNGANHGDTSTRHENSTLAPRGAMRFPRRRLPSAGQQTSREGPLDAAWQVLHPLAPPHHRGRQGNLGFVDGGAAARSTKRCVLQVRMSNDIDDRLETPKPVSIQRLFILRPQSDDLPLGTGRRSVVAVSGSTAEGGPSRISQSPNVLYEMYGPFQDASHCDTMSMTSPVCMLPLHQGCCIAC